MVQPIAAAFGGALLATALAGAPAPAQTNWDMPTPYGEGIFHTQNILQFAEDVEERTGGAMQDHSPSG